jgi:nicotinate-nucleotide pyrophosphorylase (carboxylating)
MTEGLPEAAARDVVARALAEDVGSGDVTTLATVDGDAQCRAEIVAREEGVIAGLGVARMTFEALDPEVSFERLAADGDRAAANAVLARLAGRTRTILVGERVALNFLQRMSGIATLTAQYVAAVKGTKARILDTRKTAPGLRALDKYAVRAGGGMNHRMGLFDGVLIKDNHIRAAGGIREAVERARKSAHHAARVEVEVETLEEVEEGLAAGAEALLLDNMDVGQISRAIELIAGRCETEVSGGVTLSSVRKLAECGVDYISVGALTHSAPALDIALEISNG